MIVAKAGVKFLSARLNSKYFAIFFFRNVLSKRGESNTSGEEREELQESTKRRKEISVSSIFNLLVSFYQLKALLVIDSLQNTTTIIDQVLNMEIVVQSSKKLEVLCPFHGLNAVWREVFMGFASPLIMISFVSVVLLIVKFVKCFTLSNSKVNWLLGRLYVGYYIILPFCYKNICRSVFRLINCKTFNEVTFLYIDGNIECFTSWQIATMVFLIFWVVPFPFALTLGYSLFKNKKIHASTYLLFLTCPTLCILKTCVSRWKRIESQRNTFVDERLEEIFEQPYREKFFWWESWRLIERLIVSGIAVFLTNPIYRILYMTPVFVLLAYFHFRMNPYKRSMYILKRLDSVSWFCLFLHLFINGMRAVVYIYDVPNIDFISHALQAANILEHLFTPLWYLIISFLLKKLYETCVSRRR